MDKSDDTRPTATLYFYAGIEVGCATIVCLYQVVSEDYSSPLGSQILPVQLAQFFFFKVE